MPSYRCDPVEDMSRSHSGWCPRDELCRANVTWCSGSLDAFIAAFNRIGLYAAMMQWSFVE